MRREKNVFERQEQAERDWRQAMGFGSEGRRSPLERDAAFQEWLAEDGLTWNRKFIRTAFEGFAVTEWKYRPGSWHDTAVAFSALAVFLSPIDKRLASDADDLASIAYAHTEGKC